MKQMLGDLRGLRKFAASFGVSENIEVIASQWLHGLFATAFPISVVLPIWDALLCEGWKVLFRVSLATFRLLLQPLQSDQELLLTKHKKVTQNFCRHRELISHAFYNLGTVRRKDLMKWRATESSAAPQQQEDHEFVFLQDISYSLESS